MAAAAALPPVVDPRSEYAAAAALIVPIEAAAVDPGPNEATGAERLDFLHHVHPIFARWARVWRQNERRLRGGPGLVEKELRPYEWEDLTGEHFRGRQATAGYLNLPLRMANGLVGTLSRSAPEPDADLDFGTLGLVAPKEGGTTNAQALWRNVNGPGRIAQGWNAWWDEVHRRAMATGHRWIFATAPRRAPKNKAEERRQGLRPFLVDYSPLSVPDWFLRDGTLEYARVVIRERDPQMIAGKWVNGYRVRNLLLVREGFAGLGEGYAGGGWWLFDEKDRLVQEPGDRPGTTKDAHGTWDRTDGEIPLFPFYYEPDEGSEEEPAMSRPGLTEIGQIAAAHLNLGSAGDNDAIEGGSRTLYLNGISPKNHGVVLGQQNKGSRLIGIPPDRAAEGAAARPEIFDSASVSANAAIEARQNRKIEEAALVAAEEVTWAPESSGVSKQAGFREVRSPRLALMAEQREEAQTNALHLLEQLWSRTPVEPKGRAEWSRDFDLLSAVENATELFTLLRDAGATSPTIVVKVLERVLSQKGYLKGLSDAERKALVDEIRDSMAAAARGVQLLDGGGAGDTAARAAADAAARAVAGAGDPEEDAPPVPPANPAA